MEARSGILGFSASYNQTAGATVLNRGDIEFRTPMQLQGGTLSGAGAINGSVNNSGGAVSPGASAGVLEIVNNYTQGAGGALNIEIGGLNAGSGFDQLGVGGNVTLGGRLNLSTVEYSPYVGATFKIITLLGTRTGTFATVNGTDLGSGKVFKVDYAASKVELIVQQTVQPKLTALDGAAQDWFGSAVALSGDGNIMLVGAPGADIGEHWAQGAAYVLVRSSGMWSEQQKLTASDGDTAQVFGSAVALSDDGSTLVVGARFHTLPGSPFGEIQQGAAYIFVRSGGTWNEQQKLTADDAVAGDHFGTAVAISSDGSTVMVGAPDDDIGSNNDQGSVYVFVGSGGTWSQQAKLLAADGAAADGFGSVAALSGDGTTVVVGAHGDDIGSNGNQGSAYVFVGSGGTWSQQAKLLAADGAAGDEFGSAVALNRDNGNTVVVGAWKDNGVKDEQGSAYVFVRSSATWRERQKLTAWDGDSIDNFGSAAAISADGSVAAIGAKFDTNPVQMQGSAYIFVYKYGMWHEQQKLTAADAAAVDLLGTAVALSGDGSTVAAGAPKSNVGSNVGPGAVYLFVQPPQPLPPRAKLRAPANGASLTTTSPTFEWNAAAGASSYRFELFKKNKKGFPFKKATVSATKYQPPGLLTGGGTKYFWHVQACSDVGCSPWSAWWSFTITAASASAPDTE
ncbi:MAG: hypothetical protein HY741_12925 [Chloroflexi bacterium]|nr:hypothetical protein [Chloroflexota bacterium]